MRQTRRLRFDSGRGHSLTGILESPEAPPRFHAVFAHCFTCTKDLKATVRISRELVSLGISVLRFDFTGLGESQGDFSTSTFAENVQDLVAAAQALAPEGLATRLLIGHSLGGAASLAAAHQISELQAVCTLAAPAETPHLADTLERLDPQLSHAEEGEVVIGGQTLAVRRPLLDGLRRFELEPLIRALPLPVLLVHSETDVTLGPEHALRLRELLHRRATLHLLPDTDHLFTRPQDPAYLAQLISQWAARVGLG